MGVKNTTINFLKHLEEIGALAKKCRITAIDQLTDGEIERIMGLSAAFNTPSSVCDKFTKEFYEVRKMKYDSKSKKYIGGGEE